MDNPAMMAGVMGATPMSGQGAGEASFDTTPKMAMMQALAKALRQGGLGQQQQPQQQLAGGGQVVPVNNAAGIDSFANAMSALTMGPVKVGNQTVDYFNKG